MKRREKSEVHRFLLGERELEATDRIRRSLEEESGDPHEHVRALQEFAEGRTEIDWWAIAIHSAHQEIATEPGKALDGQAARRDSKSDSSRRASRFRRATLIGGLSLGSLCLGLITFLFTDVPPEVTTKIVSPVRGQASQEPQLSVSVSYGEPFRASVIAVDENTECWSLPVTATPAPEYVTRQMRRHFAPPRPFPLRADPAAARTTHLLVVLFLAQDALFEQLEPILPTGRLLAPGTSPEALEDQLDRLAERIESTLRCSVLWVEIRE